MNGWIALHRKLLDWEWFQDAKVLQVYIYLLLDANHEDKKWKGMVIKRGQTFTSLPKISEATGLSIQEVRTCLKKLEATGNLTGKSTGKGRLITVEKYSFYQELSTGSNRQSNRHCNRQATANNNDNKYKQEVGDFSTTKISSLLTDKEWEKLDSRYEDLAELIDTVDEEVLDVSNIRKPYNYICRIADNKNWQRKLGHMFDLGS